MNVEFTLYEGFLIADYQEDKVKAYRSREFYAGNTTSYETSSPANIKLMIDEAGDHGDFDDAEYRKLMQDLGRGEADLVEVVSPKYLHHIMGRVRQHIGLDEFDTSRDEEINSMSHNAVLDHCLEWEGIIGYGGIVRGWIESIYGVSLG